MNSPVITINDQPIPWAEIMGYLQFFGKLQPFLQEFVSQYVLVQEVNSREDLEINSSDLIQSIMDFRVQQKLTDADKFNEWLKRENLNNQTFQNRIALGLKIEKLKQAIAAPDLESYFQDHQNSLEELVLHYAMSPEKELSEQIKQRLAEENLSFEDLAKEYSSSGKNIRFFKQQVQRRSLSKEVQEALVSAAGGELVGPIDMGKSWSIFRVIQIIPAKLDEKTKKQIEAQLFSEWLVEKLRHLKIEFKSVADLTEPAGVSKNT
jgi:hypothetical protein